MKYYCNICDYGTERKFNYTLHLQSKIHITKLDENNKINNDKLELINKIDKLEKQVKKYKKYKKKYYDEIKYKVIILEKTNKLLLED
jgi:hypothetical protein